MAIPPIDPSFAARGPEWGVGPLQGAAQPAAGGGGFGGMLTNAISSLDNSQVQAAQQAQSLANGTATDPNQVVMSVEQASLAMQMANQIRTKAVESEQSVFGTQV